jgi:hypothetical protein
MSKRIYLRAGKIERKNIEYIESALKRGSTGSDPLNKSKDIFLTANHTKSAKMKIGDENKRIAGDLVWL